MTRHILLVAALVSTVHSTNVPAGYPSTPTVHDEFNSLDSWNPTFDDWIGPAPAVIKSSNAFLSPNKEAVLRLKKENDVNGEAWVDSQFDGGCDCGYKSITTGVLVSKKNDFTEGYYEASMHVATESPYMAAFWLQGTNVEINVMEFVQRMMGEGGNAKAWTNYHCFDPNDDDGSETTSAKVDFIPSDKGLGGLSFKSAQSYGVDWRGDKLTFYVNGKEIRKATASCLLNQGVAEKVRVIFSLEANPDFDADNANGLNVYPEKLNSVHRMKVSDFKYYAFSEWSDPGAAGPIDCEKLGWTPIDNTCASVKIDGSCEHITQPTKTYDEASTMCAGVGARLCTIDEIKLFSQDAISSLLTGATGCSQWAKFKKVWTSDDAPSGCAAGKKYIVNGNRAGSCVSESTAQYAQCCLSQPKESMKFGDKSDQYTSPYYTEVVSQSRSGVPYSKVVARANFGANIGDSYKKKCKFASYDVAEQFCIAQGGDLCTLEQLQGDFKDPSKGISGGLLGNGATKDDTSAYGAGRKDAGFWRTSTGRFNPEFDVCGRDTAYIWIKNSATVGVATPFKAVANKDVANPTDLLCNHPREQGLQESKWNSATHNHKASLSDFQKQSGFYRPVSKRIGYMRKNFDGTKVPKQYSCTYKGSESRSKSKRLTVCCFNAEA